MGGNRRLVPPCVILVEDAECCDWRIMDPSSQRARDEPRLYRERASVNPANLGVTVYGTERNTADYGDPETDCYTDRDPWYTQSQSGRPCPETLWGYRTAMSRSVPEPNAGIEPTRPNVTAPGEGSTLRGAGRHPVLLDATRRSIMGTKAIGLWRTVTAGRDRSSQPSCRARASSSQTAPIYGEATVARGSRGTNARTTGSRWERRCKNDGCYGSIVYMNRLPLQNFGVVLVDVPDMLYIGNSLWTLAHWIAPWVLRTCLF